MAAQSLLSSVTVPTQDFLDFFDFREVFFRLFFLLGTFFPFLRASERPMAIACLRLFTVPPLPPLPLLSVPFFRRCIALFTRLLAALPYFRPPDFFFAAMLPSGRICRSGPLQVAFQTA